MENDILGDFACNVNIISNIIYFTHLPFIVLILKGTCNTGLYNGLVIYIYIRDSKYCQPYYPKSKNDRFSYIICKEGIQYRVLNV